MNTRTIQISCSELDKIHLLNDNYQHCNPAEFPGKSGVEHYKLLAWFSMRFNNSDIFDIATYRGFSALALSYNKNNTVHTFDLPDKSNLVDPRMKEKSNIKFYNENIFDIETREKWQEKLLKASLIFVDIASQDGNLEYEFYEFLRDSKYKGVIIFNDIWYYKGMRDNFWYKIPTENKYDLTEVGHWSGTGLVRFIPEEVPRPLVNSEKSWTFVTSCFDLTRCSDANESIKSRPVSFYLENAKTTMSLDVNLVVYCDEYSYNDLKELRPEYLREKTKYIVMSFEDFPLIKHRNRIILNRLLKPYQFDDANTASYYLSCMTKYTMLKETIEKNIFSSTHFAWINLCVEKMGYKNCLNLSKVIQTYRDKFSICYIDYNPPSLISNLDEYFKWGRCSFCSGFLTGNVHYMYTVCTLIEKQFMEYLELGYGHTDEQLYSAVYFNNRDLFELYYGDYHSMVTNYLRIDDHVTTIFQHIIEKTYTNKDWRVCYDACLKVLEYCERREGLASLSIQQDAFLKYLFVSSTKMGNEKLMVRSMAEMKMRELGV